MPFVYLLKSIAYDSDDEWVITILGHVRAVIPPEGRLSVVEPVLPETVGGSLPPMMYLSGLNMPVNVGGRERTEAEFRSLRGRAGFSVAGVTRLPAPAAISVSEEFPADVCPPGLIAGT
ncbi:methyltransferase [Streptomyces sp. NBC_01433]|uniref:methyltransferase n=1 Tax=Streptomyces sp. NBC_01433 TaxID=2903864 RepID=UPI00224C9367|nr:methyltransferase [Streptomyces sp. NBC_01433]MCX4673779.1 methyltransferase [Streptomyces sp. NBC_01433]